MFQPPMTREKLKYLAILMYSKAQAEHQKVVAAAITANHPEIGKSRTTEQKVGLRTFKILKFIIFL